MLSTPTLIGLIIAVIGVVAWIGGSLRVANLELNLQTTKGRITFIFAVLHVFGGLAIIIIDLFL
ncbi:hypothetical protein F7734_15025 [Scytonema sp. UIC 10036]|uniref:hypothetical protein n=1 Tax=Scytonema sp. UIC 10036 TaxID=2304196 RepID=UPI0012DA0CF6|nr:hypothetical protein [Scytonema sp. UIC 10036]MUG93660.1 hypothetical protein [Scytonema sp. UIC 10036]